MTKAKYIAFDWNGTLLDDTDIVFDATNAFLAAINYDAIDREKFHATHAIPLSQFYRNLGIDEVAMEKLLGNANGAFHDHYETNVVKAPLREGAAELLDHARKTGISTVIFSNHIEGPIRVQLKRLGIEAHFEDVIAFESRTLQFKGLTKGERLNNYLTAHKVEPANVVVIGDTEEEIQIAKKHGHISVALAGGCHATDRLTAENPDHLINSLHELKPILQERGFA